MPTKTKKNNETKAGERPMAQMADHARKNYEQAVRTGQRFQEELGQWWTRMLSQTAMNTDWQKHVANWTKITAGALPLAQRRMEEVMDLMGKNSHAGAELMRKAIEAAQTPVVAESQNKWMEFWTSSMRAVQSNVEAMTDISTKAIDSWINFVRQNTEVMEIRTPKMASSLVFSRLYPSGKPDSVAQFAAPRRCNRQGAQVCSRHACRGDELYRNNNINN